MNWGTLRPQIFISIICATVFSIVALFVGMHLDAVEIITAVVGSYVGFLAGVSLKVLESE
jgi:cell shape-determining protein MreC